MSKIIEHNLLPKQVPRKRNLNVKIDLYDYAAELYEELAQIGIIERTKTIPQLGVIKADKHLRKTRYDYIMLQLYFHQLIKKNLQDKLRFTYNNKVNELRDNFKYGKDKHPTIGDIVQLLSIVYNIGHFYNTFTASRAITITASQDTRFYDMVLAASSDPRFKDAASKLLTERNYHRVHLLNSILILENCNKGKKSVSLAIEILYSYINERNLSDESKLKYIFSIFRDVRTVSYIAYDLQIAKIPLTIDICKQKDMETIFRELLSEYNNRQPLYELIKSITKLLDDTLYNENSNAICYYMISRKMAKNLLKENEFQTRNYYNDCFMNKDSILNKKYSHKRDYPKEQILKLTFKKEDRSISEELLTKLEKTNNTRVGYYDRHEGEQTILVSIKENCNSAAKIKAAFKTMKFTVSALRRISNIESADPRFLLCVKFFLYYLFNKNPVVIKSTIDNEKCVICTRGKNSRKKELEILLQKTKADKDTRHEAEFMLNYLQSDEINDTTVCVPASIIVYPKDSKEKSCEFDGLIIHPMRAKEQIIFMEAKNTSRNPRYGKKCLREKLKKLSINYTPEDIKIIGHDAIFKYSI